MASKALKEVIERLPKLSQKDLGEVRKRLEFFVQSSPEETPLKDWLFNGIMSELRRRGLESRSARPPVSEIKRAAPSYQMDAERVRTALLAGLSFKPSPPELNILGVLSARALLEDLDGGPAPVCLQTMLQNVSKIPGAVDRCYPGYLASKLLGILVRR